MQHKKVWGLLILFVLVVVSQGDAQAIPPITTTTITTTTTFTETGSRDSSKFHIRNAYEVAKRLYKIESQNAVLSDTQAQQLLGSLIWYTNLQDESGDKYDPFFSSINEYSILDTVASKLFKKIVKLNKFFELSVAEINSLFTNENSGLKDRVIDMKRSYSRLFTEYDTQKERNLTRLPQIDKDITRLRSELKDTVDKLNKIIIEKSLEKQEIINDTTQVAKVQRLTSEISTANTDRTNIENTYSLRIGDLNFEKLTLQDSEHKKQKEMKDQELVIIKFLLETEELRRFVFKVSNVFSSANFQSVSLGIAYDVFTKQSLPEIQQLITQAEATAAKLAIKLPSEAEMINALAIYLANRIKQESVMWFFEKITQNASHYKLLNLFFPTTIKLLQGNEVYEIPNLGAQWQYALSKDFMQMPKNVLTSDWLNNRWPVSKNYASYIAGVCELAELVAKRYTYKDAIKTLYLSGLPNEDNKEKKDNLQFHDYITLLYAINSEFFLIDGADKMRMLTYEDLRSMNKKEIEIMLRLLDLKYNGVFSKFIKGIKKNSDGSNTAFDVEKIRRLFGNIQSTIGQIEKVSSEYLEEQKKLQQNGQKDWFYNNYNIWGAINQMFFVFSNLDKTIVQEKIAADAKKVVDYGEHVFEIYNLVTKKNFAGAVMNTINLIDHLFYGENAQEKFTVTLDNLKKAEFFSTTKLKQSIIGNLEKNKTQFSFTPDASEISFKKNSPVAAIFFENERHAIQMIRKLSGFLNDAALAQNDKQLAKVVESYAMPVGSYKRKRNNWWSVDLNAFAGPYIGYEWSKRQKNDTISFPPARGGAVWGISVPIGLSISKTLGRRWGKGRFKGNSDELPDDFIRNPDKIKIKRRNIYYRTITTFTLTASLVDLGAIVSYRLGKSNDTTINQSLKWAQFISPGLHLSFALKGSPFVISAGFQYTPQLRKYEEAGKVNNKQFNTTRAYLGLMFDLPLFNFWERKHIVYKD